MDRLVVFARVPDDTFEIYKSQVATVGLILLIWRTIGRAVF